ncbi:hypothetical protein V8G54_000323 [Vigna mungo]|uniref:Uncharacterized protein n=1 Tax=Vigna mungo TaxID=3915 RepID=A0AAQ3P4Y4_VIGMU
MTVAKRVLPLYATIIVIVSLLVGAESMYENGVMDLAELMKIKDIHKHMYCCYDNHVRSCKRGTKDEEHCNSLCLKIPCEKGGRCKRTTGKTTVTKLPAELVGVSRKPFLFSGVCGKPSELTGVMLNRPYFQEFSKNRQN